MIPIFDHRTPHFELPPASPPPALSHFVFILIALIPTTVTIVFAICFGVCFSFVAFVDGVLVGLNWALVYPGTFWAGCTLSKHLSKR
jgi:hypothetical protein